MRNLNKNCELSPKIYVACLAAYNNGILHGRWIDANQTTEEITNEIQAMLAKSPIANAEEWAIHDYEEFGGVEIREYESIETIVEIAEFLTEHGNIGAALLSYHCNDIELAKQAMEEYCGCYNSEEDFAMEIMNECYEVPEYLACYIDYKAFARDLFIGDYYSVENSGSLHIFRTV